MTANALILQKFFKYLYPEHLKDYKIFEDL